MLEGDEEEERSTGGDENSFRPPYMSPVKHKPRPLSSSHNIASPVSKAGVRGIRVVVPPGSVLLLFHNCSTIGSCLMCGSPSALLLVPDLFPFLWGLLFLGHA